MKEVSLTRRGFLAAAGAGLAAARAWASPCLQEAIVWRDVQKWGVEGKGWTDTARYFDRLPARAQGRVPPAVWDLSRHSAGMLVRFETDATSLHARYSLLKATLALPHMPATGVSGLDVYARDEDLRDRWLAVVKPTEQRMEVKLASNIDPRPGGKRRLYTVYLPLYNGVESLEIGLPEGASFEAVAPRREGTLVFYGTSIMHGACASRAGMSIPAILGRRLGRPTVNLGFSGNGRMEAEVGELLAELEPALYAIDCLPNMSPEQVAERAGPLVRQLRKARPRTPILLVEDRTFTSAPFFKATREAHAARRAALQKVYERLRDEGLERLSYLAGELQLGDDGEAATDGSHPSDLGMVRYADAYEKVIRANLK
jgi:lysophospholipase L1-like esterase